MINQLKVGNSLIVDVSKCVPKEGLITIFKIVEINQLNKEDKFSILTNGGSEYETELKNDELVFLNKPCLKLIYIVDTTHNVYITNTNKDVSKSTLSIVRRLYKFINKVDLCMM